MRDGVLAGARADRRLRRRRLQDADRGDREGPARVRRRLRRRDRQPPGRRLEDRAAAEAVPPGRLEGVRGGHARGRRAVRHSATRSAGSSSSRATPRGASSRCSDRRLHVRRRDPPPARKLGYRIKEVGVRWQDDGDSRSTMVGGNVKNARDLLQHPLHEVSADCAALGTPPRCRPRPRCRCRTHRAGARPHDERRRIRSLPRHRSERFSRAGPAHAASRRWRTGTWATCCCSCCSRLRCSGRYRSGIAQTRLTLRDVVDPHRRSSPRDRGRAVPRSALRRVQLDGLALPAVPVLRQPAVHAVRRRPPRRSASRLTRRGRSSCSGDRVRRVFHVPLLRTSSRATPPRRSSRRAVRHGAVLPQRPVPADGVFGMHRAEPAPDGVVLHAPHVQSRAAGASATSSSAPSRGRWSG